MSTTTAEQYTSGAGGPTPVDAPATQTQSTYEEPHRAVSPKAIAAAIAGFLGLFLTVRVVRKRRAAKSMSRKAKLVAAGTTLAAVGSNAAEKAAEKAREAIEATVDKAQHLRAS
jgi:hypothetical protein